MLTCILRSLALAALCSFSAWAADVSGKWKTSFTMPNGETREGTLDLKAEGDKLTGTMSGPRGEVEISEGRIEGDTISFSVVRNFQGNEVKIKYRGKVSSNEMKLTVDFNGREMEMTARRVQ